MKNNELHSALLNALIRLNAARNRIERGCPEDGEDGYLSEIHSAMATLNAATGADKVPTKAVPWEKIRLNILRDPNLCNYIATIEGVSEEVIRGNLTRPKSHTLSGRTKQQKTEIRFRHYWYQYFSGR